MSKLTVATGLGLFLLTAAAQAKDPTAVSAETRARRTAQGRQLTEQKKAADLEKYDLNRDGVLDAAEKEAMRLDRLARRQELAETMLKIQADNLRRFATGGGALDTSQREEMERNRAARIEQLTGRIYRSYDSNGNGVLDPAERQTFETAQQKLRALQPALRAAALRSQGPQQKAAQQAKREAFVSRMKSLSIKLFDTNGNGVLDPAELAAMRARFERHP